MRRVFFACETGAMTASLHKALPRLLMQPLIEGWLAIARMRLWPQRATARLMCIFVESVG